MTRSTEGAQAARTCNDFGRVGTVGPMVNELQARVRPTLARAMAEHDPEVTQRVSLLLFRLAAVQRHAVTGQAGELQYALAQLQAAANDWHLLLLEQEAAR